MAQRTEFFVQSFERKRKGLFEGPRDVMWTAQDAINRALVQSLRFSGVVAVMVVTDVETNTVSDVSILKQFGDVPEAFVGRAGDVRPRNGPSQAQPGPTVRTR